MRLRRDIQPYIQVLENILVNNYKEFNFELCYTYSDNEFTLRDFYHDIQLVVNTNKSTIRVIRTESGMDIAWTARTLIQLVNMLNIIEGTII